MEKENSYYCEECKRKVKAEKSLKVVEYPEYLTFVLKRFEFYSHRLKINSRFEFPFGEFIMDDGVKFELNGIIVHQGLSEIGHYFSLIKLKNKWYEFNDQNVE